MPVSKRLRYEILRRDNHTCRYCGASAPGIPLRVDHVTPIALGGSDEPTNLVTSCEPCNSGKSSSSPDATHVADVAQDALRWAAAMQQAADKLLEQEQPKSEYRDAFLAEWDRWGYGKGDDRKAVELPGDWKPSIERFRIAGLPSWTWADTVDTAMGYDKVLQANKFKYCCGIAWKKVDELNKEARRIASNGTSHLPSAEAATDAVIASWTGSFIDRFAFEPIDEWISIVREGAESAIELGAAQETLLRAAVAAGACGDPYFGIFGNEDPDFLVDLEEACFVWRTSWRQTGKELPDGFDVYCFRASVSKALISGYTQYQVIQHAARTGAAHGIDLMEDIKAAAPEGGER
jgi:hypothetical protein